MKYAMVAVLLMTPAVASVALAQEGIGHGPPKASIVVPVPTVLTTTATGGSLSSLFQRKAGSGLMMQ